MNKLYFGMVNGDSDRPTGCPSIFAVFAPLTFLIWSVVSPLGAIENLRENAPTARNAYNLVVCPPKTTKLKT